MVVSVSLISERLSDRHICIDALTGPQRHLNMKACKVLRQMI